MINITEEQIREAAKAYIATLKRSDHFPVREAIALAYDHAAKWTMSQDQWVAVSDRLPDIGDDPYLGEWVQCSNGKSVFLQAYQYCKGIGFVAYGSYRPDERVTHWQPLPSPPKKGADHE